MPTITQGNSVVLVLTPSDSITIQTRGSARLESPTGTLVAGGFTGTRTFGPFDTGSATILADVGSVEYEVADGRGQVGRVLSRRAGGLVELLDEEGNTLGASGSIFSPASAIEVFNSNQVVSRVSVNASADTVNQALHSFVLPAGMLGPNGRLVADIEATSANAGTRQLSLGFLVDATITPLSVEISMGTTNLAHHQTLAVYNTSLTAQKYRASLIRNLGNSNTFTAAAMNTSVNQTIVLACRWTGATLGGQINAEAFRVYAVYGA